MRVEWSGVESRAEERSGVERGDGVDRVDAGVREFIAAVLVLVVFGVVRGRAGQREERHLWRRVGRCRVERSLAHSPRGSNCFMP